MDAVQLTGGDFAPRRSTIGKPQGSQTKVGLVLGFRFWGAGRDESSVRTIPICAVQRSTADAPPGWSRRSSVMVSDCPSCALRLAAIERRLALLERGRSLSRSDRDALARILPAVAGALGSELFTVREVFERDAPGLRVVLRGRSSRAVGRLFARAAAQDVNGYVVERVSVERHAALWRVGVSNSHSL